MSKNDDLLTVNDLSDFIYNLEFNVAHENLHNTPIFINFGQGDGCFIRKSAIGNYKGKEPLYYDKCTFENGVLEIRLQPNCTKWTELNAKYPIKIK